MQKKISYTSKPKPKPVAAIDPVLANKIVERLQKALALHKAGQFEPAKEIYEEILKLDPKHFDSIQLLGVIATQTKQWTTAHDLYAQALAINPNSAFVFYNQGIVLKELKNFQGALASYNMAIEFKRDYADAWCNRGIVLKELRHLDVALASYDKAIEFKPDHAEAHYNRGNVLRELKRLNEALKSYDRAIDFKPDYTEAYYNRGNLLKGLKRLDEALASYDKAIEFKRDYAVAYYNRGIVLKELKQYDTSLASFEKVFSLEPSYPFIKGAIIHGMMCINKWDSLLNLFESINNDVLDGKLSASPFGYQGLSNSPMLLGKAARIFSACKFTSQIKSIYKIQNKKIQNKKIKVAYLCGEFRNQATSVLMIDLWESHDKNKFEIIGFDNGWNDGSQIRNRIEQAFDKLIDISAMDDSSAVSLINDESIDILINLNCFFGLQRNTVFAHKPASIQVNYLGFPGTLGIDYMDYIIADKTVIPIHSQDFYSEKVVYLPNSYQANDRLREIATRVFAKEELNLPKDSFVFCCFNNNYKITSNTFDGWVRILKKVEGSVLWLLEDNPTASTNLRKEAQARGLDPSRLVFAKRMDLPGHLARHRVADLFIDTLPYNAHTTASDALWAGLPVLTCMGESFAGRVASSLLNAIELPELITTTQSQFESRAIELATNPEKLKAIKDKLERNRLTTALFDTPRFTKHIEAAYTQMYYRYQSDLPPDHIYIEA